MSAVNELTGVQTFRQLKLQHDIDVLGAGT